MRLTDGCDGMLLVDCTIVKATCQSEDCVHAHFLACACPLLWTRARIHIVNLPREFISPKPGNYLCIADWERRSELVIYYTISSDIMLELVPRILEDPRGPEGP